MKFQDRFHFYNFQDFWKYFKSWLKEHVDICKNLEKNFPLTKKKKLSNQKKLFRIITKMEKTSTI